MVGRRSRNLMFWWMVFFAMIAGFVLTGMKVFGQDGPAMPPVEMVPLINLDDMFEPLTQFFTDILKEYWVLLLSLFFIWFAFSPLRSTSQAACKPVHVAPISEIQFSWQCNMHQVIKRQECY